MDGLQQNSDTNLTPAPKDLASFAGGSRWKQIPLLFGIYLLLTLSAHLLEDAFELSGLMPSDGRVDPSIAAIAFVTLVTFAWTIFSNAIGVTVIARRFFGRSSVLSILRTAELIVIETIRAMAATVLRLPLLILPGLFEWIRLTPIPYIILFDSEYQAGRVDALEAARIYFKLHYVRVLSMLLLALALFGIEFALTSSGEHPEPLWVDPLPQLGFIVVFAVLRLFCDIVIIHTYSQTFRQAAISADDAAVEKKSNIL